MKTIIEPDQNHTMLEKWRGSRARIWIFDISLVRLVLRLERTGESEVLYILGASCKHIVGPFSWDNSSVSIESGDESGKPFDAILDKEAGFEVRCRGVALALGPAVEFDKTLDSFIDGVSCDPLEKRKKKSRNQMK
jgi:hypothetical protein